MDAGARGLGDVHLHSVCNWIYAFTNPPSHFCKAMYRIPGLKNVLMCPTSNPSAGIQSFASVRSLPLNLDNFAFINFIHIGIYLNCEASIDQPSCICNKQEIVYPTWMSETYLTSISKDQGGLVYNLYMNPHQVLKLGFHKCNGLTLYIAH